MTKRVCLLFLSCMASSALGEGWTDKVKMDGDFRGREEYVKNDENAPRYRARIRARLGVGAEVSDEVKVGFKLATGELASSNTSANQTLGEEFENKYFSLSRAWVTWQAAESVAVTFGKMETPIFRPQGSQLIWDEDLGPEGLNVNWDCQCSEGTSHFVNASSFVLQERYDSTKTPNQDLPDPAIYMAQVGGRYSAGTTKINWALAYMNFANVKGGAVIDASQGNSVTGGTYTHHYEVTNLGLEVLLPEMSWPFAFYADFAQNTTIEDDNQGYLVGIKFGKTKARNDVELGYNYRKVEKDATLSSLNDSDFSGGKDDTEGHQASVKYAFSDKSSFGFTYFKSEIGISGTTTTDYDRAHADFVFKF